MNCVLKLLADVGADSAIVTSRENVFYLSGFMGSAGCVIATKHKCVLVTDGRYSLQAKQQSRLEIEITDNIHRRACELLAAGGAESVAFEEDHMTYKQYEFVVERLSSAELLPFNGAISALRQTKRAEEIERIREAASLADAAFAQVRGIIKPGISELEVAIELEMCMRRLGAQSTSFETIVVSGIRTAMPHGSPTMKEIQSNELVTMDFGCVLDGYCSDITRTIAVGTPPPQLVDLANIVYYTQLRALDCLVPNMLCSDVDKRARDIFSNFGVAQHFTHGLGHGVGINVHERPRLSPKSNDKLLPGSVITVEPGVYIEGVGGIRIEDMVLITETGMELLTKSPKELYA